MFVTPVWVSGPLVLWTCGPLVLWSPGPLDLWSSGPLVPWSSGPLVLWSLGIPTHLSRLNQHTSVDTAFCNPWGGAVLLTAIPLRLRLPGGKKGFFLQPKKFFFHKKKWFYFTTEKVFFLHSTHCQGSKSAAKLQVEAYININIGTLVRLAPSGGHYYDYFCIHRYCYNYYNYYHP